MPVTVDLLPQLVDASNNWLSNPIITFLQVMAVRPSAAPLPKLHPPPPPGPHAIVWLQPGASGRCAMILMHVL